MTDIWQINKILTYKHSVTFTLCILILHQFFAFSTTLKAQKVITNAVKVQHLDKVLTNSTVISMHQDHLGYIWFGTFNGLNRYNGVNIEEYYSKPEDSTSLSNYYIEKIAHDSNGNIWVATQNGLNK